MSGLEYYTKSSLDTPLKKQVRQEAEGRRQKLLSLLILSSEKYTLVIGFGIT